MQLPVTLTAAAGSTTTAGDAKCRIMRFASTGPYRGGDDSQYPQRHQAHDDRAYDDGCDGHAVALHVAAGPHLSPGADAEPEADGPQDDPEAKDANDRNDHRRLRFAGIAPPGVAVIGVAGRDAV